MPAPVRSDMKRQTSPHTAAARHLVLGLSALALVACSSAVDVAKHNGRDDAQSAIDPRSYYNDYSVGSDESWLWGSPSTGTSSGVTEDQSLQGGTGEPHEPGLLEDNTFVDAGTSGFTDPRDDPMSTFALDIDTGSYSVGRTLLRSGLLPPADSIRPEEWVNAFDYQQPAPTDADLGLEIDQMRAPSTTDGTQLVRIGVKAREVTSADRLPVALTLVVDTSGSMDIRERLGLVKASLALLAKHLKPTDTVAVVTYEATARPLLEPTPISDTEAILAAINDLEPGGSTNLEAGLKLGYRQARAAYREDAVNAVILASDGVANVGTTGPDAISTEIRRAGSEGIHLVTVGYGMGNYNDNLMEQLADQGDGFYAYVDTYAEAERLFVDDLTSTLTPVAKEAKVQVTFDPAVVSSYRLIGYENRALADDDFTDDSVDAGEIGAGHDVTALYEVQLAADAPVALHLGDVTLRWESAETGDIEELTSALAAAEPSVEPVDELMLAATVADFAQLLKQAAPVSDRQLDLDDLAERADALATRGVDGAAQLSNLIAQARAAR